MVDFKCVSTYSPVLNPHDYFFFHLIVVSIYFVNKFNVNKIYMIKKSCRNKHTLAK